MLQVLKFRKMGQGDPVETGFSEKKRLASIHELLNTDVISQFPEAERYNVVCTVSHCKETKGRVFESQNVIGFDIDDVDFSDSHAVIDVFCNTLLLDKNKLGAIHTGNGLHLFVEVDPFTDKTYFELNRAAYSAVCSMVQKELGNNAIQGTVDVNFFAPTRTTRVPGSINDKTHKGGERKPVQVVLKDLELQDFDLASFKSFADIQDDAKRQYGKLDIPSVLECPFLVYCKENAASIVEPEWHAMIGILSFLPDGQDLCHEYSKGHAGYRPDVTERKILSCAKMTGPRTCANIATMFEGCKSCKHLGKVTSPLQIKNDDFIETKDTGFHKIIEGKNGQLRYIPVPQDLVKYFNQQTPFVTEPTGAVYTAQPPFYIWRQVTEVEINEFATTHYKPSANNTMRSEFRGEVAARNVVEEGHFLEAGRGFLNLRNGVLDLHTLELLPHDRKYRFMYALDYDYDPHATSPVFDQALHNIMCRDEDLKAIFLEFLGLCISGDSNKRFEKALILTGQGSNGKSTLIDMIRVLVGKQNTASFSITNLKNPQSAVALRGKLVNLVPEMESDDFSNSAYFKSLISGEPQSMKILYAQPFSERIDAKFVMACNSIPQTRDWTHGMMRRFLILPLHAKFSDKSDDFDRDIGRKFIDERSGILNKAIEGYRRLNKNNAFTESKVAAMAINDYREMNDSVSQWLENKAEINYAYLTPYTEVYKSYAEFCKDMGFKPLASTRFTTRLKEFDSRIQSERVQQNGQRSNRLRGIKLNGGGHGF